MKNTIRLGTKVVMFYFFIVAKSYAGNEPLLKGEGYIRFGTTYTNYNSVFDNDGERKAVPNVTQSHYFLSGEYSFANKWTASFKGPVYVSNKVKKDEAFNINEDIAFSGLGDFDLGIRYYMKEAAAWRAAILLTQGIGLATDNQKNGLNTGNRDFKSEIGIKVIFRKFTRWNMNGTTGFTKRNNGFSDEFFAKAEVNVHSNEKYNLAIKSSATSPLENGDKNKPIGFFGIYQNNAGFWNYQLEFTYLFNDKFSAAVEYTGFIKGQYINSQPIFGLQFNYHFNRNTPIEN